jgi:hypothetical protein
MTQLPNPSATRVAFRTRAEAENARIMPGVSVIFIGNLAYVRDAAGTALTTRGGQNWSPFGRAYLAHWGVTGVANNSQPAVQPYMAAPSANEGPRIQAAFDWAVARGDILEGDPTRVYGTTVPLVFGARGGGTAKNGAILRNFNVRAMPGTWTAGTRVGTNPDAWTYGDAVLTIGKALDAGGAGKPQIGAEYCRVDAARIAPVSVRWMGAAASVQMHVLGERGTEADLFCGWPGDNTPAPIDLDGWANTGSTFICCEGQSFKFSERSDGVFGADDGTGWWGLTGRTAHTLVVRNSDQVFVNCVAATGLHALILGKGFSSKFQGCKFWNGKAKSNTASLTAIITEGAQNYVFDACTFQEGRTSFRSFIGKADGCKFESFVHGSMELRAAVSGETAATFVFTGNTMDEDNAVMATTGAGTWGDFGGVLVGNQKNDGTPFAVQGKLMVHGGFEVQNGGRVKVPVVSFTPNVGTAGRAGEILFAADGNLYAHTGTAWRQFTGTTVV